MGRRLLLRAPSGMMVPATSLDSGVCERKKGSDLRRGVAQREEPGQARRPVEPDLVHREAQAVHDVHEGEGSLATLSNKTTKTQTIYYTPQGGKKTLLGSLPKGVTAGVCTKGPAGFKTVFSLKGSTSTLTQTLS